MKASKSLTILALVLVLVLIVVLVILILVLVLVVLVLIHVSASFRIYCLQSVLWTEGRQNMQRCAKKKTAEKFSGPNRLTNGRDDDILPLQNKEERLHPFSPPAKRRGQ